MTIVLETQRQVATQRLVAKQEHLREDLRKGRLLCRKNVFEEAYQPSNSLPNFGVIFFPSPAYPETENN